MMRKILLTLQLAFVVTYATSQILTPRQLFPGLFEAVQLSDIFPDNKTFVDATPKRDPALIMKEYNDHKDKAGFDLKQFVMDNFYMPEGPKGIFKSDINTGIRKHIDTLWQVLSRKHDT